MANHNNHGQPGVSLSLYERRPQTEIESVMIRLLAKSAVAAHQSAKQTDSSELFHRQVHVYRLRLLEKAGQPPTPSDTEISALKWKQSNAAQTAPEVPPLVEQISQSNTDEKTTTVNEQLAAQALLGIQKLHAGMSPKSD